ncbi:unnamed protein product [Sphagnum jensenii]|uniref:Uncharacterized protein n=1 Tax=Sphagnum jensenii TaxID=128206 RepID=A0ABP1B148_9BRYO
MKIMRSSCLSLNTTLHKEGRVLCPLCKARHLQQNKQVITCGCGKFQLDTQDDQVCNLSVHSLLFQSKYVCLNMPPILWRPYYAFSRCLLLAHNQGTNTY